LSKMFYSTASSLFEMSRVICCWTAASCAAISSTRCRTSARPDDIVLSSSWPDDGAAGVAAPRGAQIKDWDHYGLKTWIEAAKKRLHHNVLAIALANKLARIAWAVLNKERNFGCVRTAATSSRPARAWHPCSGPSRPSPAGGRQERPALTAPARGACAPSRPGRRNYIRVKNGGEMDRSPAWSAQPCSSVSGLKRADRQIAIRSNSSRVISSPVRS
jgi:hypothetical protein